MVTTVWEGNAKKLVAAVVLLGAGIGGILWFAAGGSESGRFVKADFERQVAVETARVVGDLTSGASRRVGILAFVSQKAGPYVERLETLTDALEEAGHTVVVWNPIKAGIKMEDHYTPAVEDGLPRLEPDILVVLTTGSYTRLNPHPDIDAFVRRGGRFVFVGGAEDADSPVFDLIRAGSAVAVTKNMGLLAKHAPKSRTLAASDPEDFFNRYYTVLTQDNLGEFISSGGR